MSRLTALACTLLTTLAVANADPGLLFHAGFEDTLEAWSLAGKGAPAQVIGPQPEFLPGRLGKALLCGPGLPLVHYPTEGNVLPESGTVSLWVCPLNWTPDDEAFHSFFESGSGDGKAGWLIFYKYYQQGWLLLRYALGNAPVGMAKATDLGWQAGQWHHLAGTWSREAMRIYVDGDLVAEAPEPFVTESLGDTFKLGDDGWHIPHEGARTLLDEVRVYAYPLSPERIRALALRHSMTVTRDPAGTRWHVALQLPAGLTPAGVRVEVLPAGGDQPVLTVSGDLAGTQATAEIPTADLQPGVYTVLARLLDDRGEVLATSQQSMRRLDQDTLSLQNDRLRVVLDGATGAVLSIEDLRAGRACRVSVPAPPLFRVDTLDFKHAWFHRPSDLKPLAGSDEALKAASIERRGEAEELTMTWEWDSGVQATLTARLPAGSSALSLQLRVRCPRPPWPSRAVRAPAVEFPRLSGLRIGEQSSDDLLASGYIQGELLANPAGVLGRERVVSYPGSTCLPWQDLYDASGGVALVPFSDGRCQLEIIAGAEEGLVRWANRWHTLLQPGEEWNSPEIELRVHEGAWYDTAERFRQWALQHTPVREQPDWLATCDGWTGAGSETYTFAGLPEMLARAREYGLSYLQLWSEMIGGIAYYCYFYPNPKLGTVEELKRGIAAVHEAGGQVGFYSNAITFDGAIDQNPWIERIATEHGVLDDLPPRPKFYEEVARQVFIGPEGQLRSGTPATHSLSGYLDGYWPMDPNSRWWQDYLAGWIAQWHDEYGADIWYLDSFPVHGYGLGPASYALHLDRPRGLSAGQIQLLERIRERFAGPMLYEGVACAALMPWTNWCLGTELAFGSGTWSRPEIFVYSLGDVYPVFSGTCNTWKGIERIFPDLSPARHEDAMNYVFLLGERFDALNLWQVSQTDPFGAHMKQLIALRARVRDVVYAGRMMDVRGLSGMPERVEARVFVRAQPAGAVVTVWDRRPERTPWRLRIDTSALPWPAGLTAARALLLDGTELPADLAREGGVLSLAVPAAEVCALSFR